MDYSVIIVAAGSGSRLKLGYNKVYYKMDENTTILQTTMGKFLSDDRCKQLVIVTDMDLYGQMVNYTFCGRVMLAQGGKTRQESVFNGLLAVNQEYVMVHDGARPFVSVESIDRLVDCMEKHDACLLMVDAKDTIKQVVNGRVVTTYNRSECKLAQTPQGFKTSLLFDCYKKAFAENIDCTDDASVVELCSDEAVMMVEGDYSNIKITTMEDLK